MAQDRSIVVRLRAEVNGFKAAMADASKSTDGVAKSSESNSKKASKYLAAHRDSINQLSNAAIGLGVGLLGASALATKAAMDWESSWAGVQKTVEGTDAEMANLEAGLRDMAKTLPATHSEIAAVAEAAGQLGVGVNDVQAFTRVMIDMGESTNLSAEEAATSLARFMNVMGTSQDDVGRLGAAVVGLGNNFATTESEIVEMGQRLSGAGAQAGLTEGDVLGLAAAMSSVGIEAEAGGSAMSLTMKRIGKSVDEGGESLELFAQVAGMSASEFSQAWQSDPAMALDAFITGLSQVEEQGMTTNGVLSELGITGIRESDALLRLSAAAGTTAEAMAQGNAEFEAGTALVEEASKRYETAESKIAMMRNAFVDLGIDLGGSVAPALAGAADNVSFLIGKFQELPDVAKQALGAGAGITGMALLAVGGLGKALTSASDLKLAMDNLGIATQGAGAKMKMLGVATGVGLAVGALTSIVGGYIGQAAKAESASQSLADAFDEVTGRANESADFILLQELNKELDKASWDKLSELGYEYEDFTSAIMAGGEEMAAFRAQLHEEWVNAPLLSAERDALSEAVGALDTVGKGYQLSAEQAKVWADQQGNAATSAEEAAAAQQVLEGAISETGVALDGVVEDMQTFLDLLFETGLATMSTRDAQAAFHESIEGVDDAVKAINEDLGGMGQALNDNKTDFDLTTEAGRTANSAFQEIAQSGIDLTKSMAENNATQEELQGSLDQTYDDLVKAASGMGLSEQAAIDLAREVLGVPDSVDIETWMDDQAEKQAQATKSALDNIPRRISTTVTTSYITRGSPSTFAGAQSNNQRGFATGGAVFGPGTGTSDSIPALLSNGEHVMTAAEVAKAGGHLAVDRMRASIRSGMLRFANGGGVANGGYAPQVRMAPAPASARAGGPVTAMVDSAALTSAVRAGMEDATVVASISNRVAAELHMQGRRASMAMGGR